MKSAAQKKQTKRKREEKVEPTPLVEEQKEAKICTNPFFFFTCNNQ